MYAYYMCMCMYMYMYMYVLFAVIATSGIDYNIKLWEPVAAEQATLSDLDEVSTLYSTMYMYI